MGTYKRACTACIRCGLPLSGKQKQFCASCALLRKKETGAAYWQRVADAKNPLTCLGCGTTYKVRCGKPSLRQYCQPCALAIRRQTTLENDRARSKTKRRNVVRSRANAAAYRRTHRDWHRAQAALYKRRHPEKVREQVNRRRAVRAGAEGRITIEEFWVLCERAAWHCDYCHKLLDRRTATMDHVLPLVSGGRDDISNIVPACRSCNASKGRRTLRYLQAPLSLPEAIEGSL